MNIIWARSIVSVVLLAVLCVVVGALLNVKAGLILAIFFTYFHSFMSSKRCSHRTGNATHGSFEATMDHSDIRGLVTALHCSVAGLPRSSIGDHLEGCPHSLPEGSPHRVPRIALPIRCVAGQLMILTPD